MYTKIETSPNIKEEHFIATGVNRFIMKCKRLCKDDKITWFRVGVTLHGEKDFEPMTMTDSIAMEELYQGQVKKKRKR